MGNQSNGRNVAAAEFTLYRITPEGRAAAAREPTPLRCRYLRDLLDLLGTCGRDIAEVELRQFMPPASLTASISTLLELGLIDNRLSSH